MFYTEKVYKSKLYTREIFCTPLYDAVERLLWHIDPVCFKCCSRPSEYGIEVIDIVYNLFNCGSGSDVKELFCEVIVWWFYKESEDPIRYTPDEYFDDLYEFYLLNPVPIIRVPVEETGEG
jgi:hypothetical protein